MKHIISFYKKHKFAAFFTFLWFAFMTYITITGLKDGNAQESVEMGAGIFAGIVMFVPGTAVIAIVCAILSRILETFSNVSNKIKAHSEDRKIEDPVIPSGQNPEPSPSTSQVEYTRSLLDRVNKVSDTLRTTTDRAEFYNAFNELTEIFHLLTNIKTSMNVPDELLNSMNDIINNKQVYVNMFENRIYRLTTSYDYMDGHDFEYFCADLLNHNGFHNVEVTKGSGDQGIDIIAEKDGIKYGIQCKCYSGNIGNSAVQQAFSGKTFYGCHVAAVLTNRFFTESAKALAEQSKVLLWDRDYLQSLIDNANNAPA